MFTFEEIKSLNELELEVYNYISLHHESVMNMKIRELAKEAHVSTTTILRFCKKMQCDGYSEFKLKFKIYMEGIAIAHQRYDTQTMLDFFHKIDTTAFKEKFKEAALIMQHYEKVIFLGIGTSGILAKYGARYFSNIGKFSLFIDDPFFPVPKGLYDDSIIVALSVSGESEQTLNIVNRFKTTHCKIIAITNSASCTLARMSNISLAYYIPEELLMESVNVTSQVPVIYMIETLGREIQSLMEKK